MDYFFNNVEMIIPPNETELVLFSCDNIYFEKYGIFNLFSCNDVDQNIHIHVINPSDKNLDFLKKINSILKIKLSYSIEFIIEELNFYDIKSYYYCSRFYVAMWLFRNFFVKKVHIVDADVIFHEKIFIPKNITLGLNYNPAADNLWQKIKAGYIYITDHEINFLNEVLAEYKVRYLQTDFEEVSKIEDKIQKANYTGLDQVCLAFVFEKTKKNLSPSFLNVRTSELHIIGKTEKDSKIWALLGKAKKNKVENYLYNKYINYFEKIDYDTNIYRV